ncbi:MAG: hypothetical protein ACE5FH_09175 [Candidatus Zixiibacteriota bacterium]
MAVSKQTKEAVKKQLQKKQPLMDVAQMKERLIEWLTRLGRSEGIGQIDWSNRLRVRYPVPGEEELEQGARVRLALPVYTGTNRYVLSVIECLKPESRANYTICVHVNWTPDEFHLQKLVETGYRGQFDGSLRAGHTVWAQNFLEIEFEDALTSCILAILGHELSPEPPSQTDEEQVERPVSVVATFPNQIDD